jgi:hypothetical protein
VSAAAKVTLTGRIAERRSVLIVSSNRLPGQPIENVQVDTVNRKSAMSTSLEKKESRRSDVVLAVPNPAAFEA